MNLKALKDTPPWDWAEGTGKMLLDILRDARAGASDRLVAAELAGDLVVMEDTLAHALLTVLRSGDEAEALRGQAQRGRGRVGRGRGLPLPPGRRARGIGPPALLLNTTEFGAALQPGQEPPDHSS